MRPVVSVQTIANSGQGPSVRHLLPGHSVTIGTCLCEKCGFDLPLSSNLRAPVTARVTAYHDHWRIDNLSDGLRLVIEDLENAQHLVTVPAARTEMVMPFELARVQVLGTTLAIVYGPEPADSRIPRVTCPALAVSGAAGQLDRSTVHFSVLLALCEPRLRGIADAPLPTSVEIARSLRKRSIRISPAAVDSHIAYLVEKLNLKAGAGVGSSRGWRKERLASTAIRHGLIGPEDLPD